MKSKNQDVLEILYDKESSNLTAQDNPGAKIQEPDWWNTWKG